MKSKAAFRSITFETVSIFAMQPAIFVENGNMNIKVGFGSVTFGTVRIIAVELAFFVEYTDVKTGFGNKVVPPMRKNVQFEGVFSTIFRKKCYF